MHIFYQIAEFFFSLGLFINAMLFIPQIIKLYKLKNSETFSLTTFLGFFFIQLFTILHAYFKHDLILLLGYLLSLVTCGTLTAMIIYYQWAKAKTS